MRGLDTDVSASTVGAVVFTESAKEELRCAQADTLVDTAEVFVAALLSTRLVDALVDIPDVTFNVKVSSGLD